MDDRPARPCGEMALPRSARTSCSARGWLVGAAILLASGVSAANDAARVVSLGWSAGARELPDVALAPPQPALVRLVVRWSDVEPAAGAPDWSQLEPVVDALARSGSSVVLALDPEHATHLPQGGLPSPLAPEALEAWLGFVRGTVRAFRGRIHAIEVGSGAALASDADAYAFLLKASALAVRAESPDDPPRVVQAPVPVEDLAWARALWERDVAAYVDVVSVRVRASGEPLAIVQFLGENLQHPPAAAVWAYVERAPDSAWAAPAGALRALGAGASAALFDVVAQNETPGLLRWVAGAEHALGAGFATAPRGVVRFESFAGEPRADAEALAAFLGPDGSTKLVWYLAPLAAGSPGDDRIVLDTPFVTNARVLDPLAGQERPVGSAPGAAGERVRVVPILRSPAPCAVAFERPAASAGFDLAPEQVETEGTRELTAEEILARYQQVQRSEDDRLERWIAEARIDYHAKLAQGGSSIEVSIDARYFWERGGSLEWEETGYRVNGNRVRWEKFPEIPLIQPEKVFTLPLDLTLDRTYRYRSLGRETIEGREAYVLEFVPADPAVDRSLYRGRVWIDAHEFYRAKVALLQTRVESPVLSNEELDHYERQVDGQGGEFRLLARTSGQQNWSVGGRTVVVRREVTFERYSVNPAPEEFARQRAEAYASDRRMIRDTDEGIRYLARNPDGTRTVKPVDTNQWLAAAGAFEDSASGGVQGFAGANYFDYDLADRGIQVNALLGGVLYLLTASKPDVGGGTSATLDAFASAIYFADQVFVGQEELDAETVDARAQSVDLRFGLPLSTFVRLNLVGGVGFQQYDDNDDSNAALAAYNAAHPGQSVRLVVPQDHRELDLGLELEFNRRGYSVVGNATWSDRSDWAAFGPFDDSTGEFVHFDPASASYVPGAPDPVEERFARYGVTASREWYLPSFQKLRAELQWLDGSRLDRFSSYQFSLFGEDRLNGFAGTGVRFDRGWIARAGWSFNLFEAIRFDAVLETSGVNERGAPDAWSSFSGAGLAATVLGPWKTVWNVSYGRAIHSDIPQLDGSDEFFFLVLKLF